MYLVIKIIGCILLVSATTLMGFKKAQRLYKRRDFINDFLVFLDTLATNIRYSTDELSIILSKSEDRFGKAIYGAYEKYDGTFFKKWKNAVADISDGYALKHEDKQLLCSFGEKLGITDVEGQLKHIELYKGLANALLDDSKNEIKQKSRLYKTMGFFVGTAAALVII